MGGYTVIIGLVSVQLDWHWTETELSLAKNRLHTLQNFNFQRVLSCLGETTHNCYYESISALCVRGEVRTASIIITTLLKHDVMITMATARLQHDWHERVKKEFNENSY